MSLFRSASSANAGFTRTFAGTELLLSPEAGALQLSLLRDKDCSLAVHPSPAFFYLFVGLDGTDEELELPAQKCIGIDEIQYPDFRLDGGTI